MRFGVGSRAALPASPGGGRALRRAWSPGRRGASRRLAGWRRLAALGRLRCLAAFVGLGASWRCRLRPRCSRPPPCPRSLCATGLTAAVPGTLVLLRRLGFAGAGRLAHPGDGLADQLLDRRQRLGVDRADDGDGGAGLAGAAGAADPVHIVVGVVRHVEIEHVADVRNIEPARGDVGGDQQLDLALAEAVERSRAGRLIQVAVQRGGGEPVAHAASGAAGRLRSCDCRR